MGSGRTRHIRAVLLGGAFVALQTLVGSGPPVLAQEQPALQTEVLATGEPTETAPEAEGKPTFADEVTVTGTLIPCPTVEALSPVTVVEPEEITYSGATRIEDLIRTLPQVFGEQNSTIANGSSGTATIDLRQLGSSRTLVLINGRRMAPGDPAGAISPDLNTIPAALVKRVDVLTGGASATYGSDAVAGVVNFILDTDFEGVRGDVQYSFYQHDNDNSLAQSINADRGFDYPSGSTTDGGGIDANVAFGGTFGEGKGHASAFVGYRKLDDLTKAERDYLNCVVEMGDDGPECSGNSITPRGRFVTVDPAGFFTGDWTLNWVEDGGDGHSFRPRTGADVFNYAPYNHIQRPDERWSAGAFVNYLFSDHVEGYAELMFMNDSTDAQIAPSGNFGNVNRVNCDNPMLSDQQRDIICTQSGYGPDDYANVIMIRRSVESGPRYDSMNHSSFRMLAGFRGDLDQRWSYDAYGLHAETTFEEVYHNDLDVSRMANALDVIVDPATGEWVCRDPQARAAGCVPWNIFQEGG